MTQLSLRVLDTLICMQLTEGSLDLLNVHFVLDMSRLCGVFCQTNNIVHISLINFIVFTLSHFIQIITSVV